VDQRDSKSEFQQKLHDEIRRNIHERIEQQVKRPKVLLANDIHWGFAWGLIITATGVVLLLYHTGIIHFNPLTRFWPLLLILFGVMNLLTLSGRFFGLLLILAGTVLELNKLGLTRLSFADLWPLAIIAVGLLLMWGSLETRGFRRVKARVLEDLRDQVAGAGVPPDTLNAVAIFGGCERRVTMKNFRGGKVTAAFGGVELDFRDADIESGANAILEVNCIFGGVQIRVPENWNVHSRSLPVFGGYEDKTRQPSGPAAASAKTLLVTGMVIFGGVEISN
jgi:predicted membrane protein